MQAGKLRDKITITQPSTITDSVGETVATTTTIAIVSAHISADTGNEAFNNQQTKGQTRYKVIIRYLADITSDMSILWGTKTLQILSAYSDQKKRSITMDALETI